MHAGQYKPQGTFRAVKYDPQNLAAQCVRCNKWLDGNLFAYATALEKRYGFGILQTLVASIAGFVQLRKADCPATRFRLVRPIPRHRRAPKHDCFEMCREITWQCERMSRSDGLISYDGLGTDGPGAPGFPSTPARLVRLGREVYIDKLERLST